MDFDDELPSPANAGKAGSDSEGSQSGSDRQGKRKSTAPAATDSSKKPKQAKSPKMPDERHPSLCYILVCDERKNGKSKYCKEHKKVTDAILYQAERQNRKAEVEKVLSEQVQCTKAVQDFQKENPPGRFRKKLIDFGQWFKTYSVETAITGREAVELYSFSDFSDDKTKSGWDLKAILKKWQEYEQDPGVEHEGDSLWLPLRKQKFRDETKKISNAYQEASKAIKDPKPEDAKNLRQFCHNAAASFADPFLCGSKDSKDRSSSSNAPGAGPAQEEEEELAPDDKTKNKKKRKTVDIANAVATNHEKDSSKVQKARELLVAAIAAAKEACRRAHELSKLNPLNESGKLFLKTCENRLACAQLWAVESEDDLNNWLKLNDNSAAAKRSLAHSPFYFLHLT